MSNNTLTIVRADTPSSPEAFVGTATALHDDKGQFIRGITHWFGAPDLTIHCGSKNVHTTDAREFGAAANAVSDIVDRLGLHREIYTMGMTRLPTKPSVMDEVCSSKAINAILANPNRPLSYR